MLTKDEAWRMIVGNEQPMDHVIGAIQLDAYKAGMMAASEIANSNQYSMVSQVVTKISRVANQLTTDNLTDNHGPIKQGRAE